MSTLHPKQEAQPLFEEEAHVAPRVQPELEALVLRFWDMVRKSADVIVTLRQENASLQAKLQQAQQPKVDESAQKELLDALTDSEATVHALREEVAAISALRDEVEELRSLNATMALEVDRLLKLEVVLEHTRQQEQELLDKLAVVQAEAEEMRRAIDRTEDVTPVVIDQQPQAASNMDSEEVANLTSQLMQVRMELESRTMALQELRAAMLSEAQDRPAEQQADVEQIILEREALRARVDELDLVAQRYAEAQERIVELEDTSNELREELARTMAVVNKYRAAGMAYLEDPAMEGQVPLFGMEAGSKAVSAYMTEAEALELANRIDAVAQKLAELL